MKSVTYAIGDIHGRLDLLNQLLDLIEADAVRRQARAKIVFTGDYVDRGADSYGVVERVMAGPRRLGDVFVALRGNHDDLFVKAVTLKGDVPAWAWQLHRHAITSYGIDRGTRDGNEASLRRHAGFLAALPLTHDDGTHLFVHAGIRPGVPIEQQTDEDLLWIRAAFLDHAPALPRRVVHGHTIMGDSPVETVNRISIDTGAFRSGILTAAVIDEGIVSFLQAVGEPDRGAIVREILLGMMMRGEILQPRAAAAHANFIEGVIDEAEMERRTRGVEA